MIARTALFVAGAILLSTALLAQPTIYPGPVLTVVDGATGKTLPGAEVTFVELSALTEDDDYDALFERYGVHRRCDDAGRVRFPAHVGTWLVEGRHGRLWNRSTHRVDREQACKISLHPEDDPGRLVVQVVDARGRPVAGVPVELLLLWGHTVRPVSVTRGPDGIAEFRLTRDSLSAVKDGSGLCVQLGIFGPEAVRKYVKPPCSPVRMTLPECGRVTVNMRLDDGTPVPDGAGLRILAWQWPLILQVHPVQDGRFDLPHVRPGCRVRIEPDAFNGFHIPLRGYDLLDAPSVPGERVVSTVAVRPIHPLLVGRVLLPGGRPADHPYRLMFQRVLESGEVDDRVRPYTSLHAHRDPFHLALDHEGHFCLGVHAAARYRRLNLRAVRAGQVWACGSIALDGTYSNGLHDLGTIRLAPSCFVASGTVVDPTGRPVDGAEVAVVSKTERDASWWRQYRRMRSLFIMPIGHRPRENGHDEFRVVTDREGRFEIWAEPREGPIDLEVEAEGFAPTVFKGISPGSKGLKLVPGDLDTNPD
jgi:hypothetical protein